MIGPKGFLLLVILLTTAIVPAHATRTAQAYHTTDTILKMYKDLASRHPQEMSQEVIGRSIQGRDILLFRIGNPNGGRLLFDGRLHGNEDGGTEAGYLFAKWILESGDAEATKILQENYVLIIPVVDMDSYSRLNARSRYVLSDGSIIYCGGVDLNRNFVVGWGAGSSDPFDPEQRYKGLYAGSEPETQAVRYAMEKYRPDVYVDWHIGGYEVALYVSDEDTMDTTSRVLSEYNNILKDPKYSALDGGTQSSRLGGMAAADGAYFGASSWLVEACAWEDLPNYYSDFISTTYSKKILPILLSMCRAIAVQAPDGGFNDGFESRGFTQWDGVYTSSGESATVVTSTYSGQYCARFSSDGDGGFESSFAYKSVTLSEVVAGAAVRLEVSGMRELNDRVHVIRIKSGSQDLAFAGWRIVNGYPRWSLVVRDGNSWTVVNSNQVPSTSKWYDIELRWTADPTDGYGELYVDGAKTCSSYGLDTSIFGSADTVRFGLAEVVYCGPTTMLGDDFYLNSEYEPSCMMQLESLELGGSSTNLGTMVVEGDSMALPDETQVEEKAYSISYQPITGYEFDHWETSGDVAVSYYKANPATFTVSGDSAIKAVYVATSVPQGFSDGFESGSFNAWTGTWSSEGDSLSISSSQKREGVYSARYYTNGDSLFEASYSYVAVPSSSEFLAEGYVMVAQSGMNENNDRLYFIKAKSGSDDVAYAGWRMVDGSIRWGVIIRDGSSWVTLQSTLVPKLGQWYYVELHWVGSSTIGYTELYVDGVRVCYANNSNTIALGEVDLIRFGLSETYGCGQATVYGDSFSISYT